MLSDIPGSLGAFWAFKFLTRWNCTYCMVSFSRGLCRFSAADVPPFQHFYHISALPGTHCKAIYVSSTLNRILDLLIWCLTISATLPHTIHRLVNSFQLYNVQFSTETESDGHFPSPVVCTITNVLIQLIFFTHMFLISIVCKKLIIYSTIRTLFVILNL